MASSLRTATDGAFKRAAASVLLALAMAGLPDESAAVSDLLFENSSHQLERIPLDRIELDPCPPRCSARDFSLLNPSAVYRPVEPDEWIFDGESQVVWAGARAEFFLVWGDSRASSIVVWDETMWVDPDIEFVGSAIARAMEAQRYTVSKELRIPSPVEHQKRRIAQAHAGRYDEDSEDFASPELDALGAVPPEKLWTDETPSRLSALLEWISKSRSAVAGLTLGLVWLMLRLVR